MYLPQQRGGRASPEEPHRSVGRGTDRKVRKPPKTPERSSDRSGEALASLSEKYRKIFTDLPMDQPFSPDQIVKLGYSTVDVLTAMTVLEVKGLVRSLPGGLYQRN